MVQECGDQEKEIHTLASGEQAKLQAKEFILLILGKGMKDNSKIS